MNFYQAAALQYTFEDIPLGSDAGTDLSSDDMRAAMRMAETTGLVGSEAMGTYDDPMGMETAPDPFQEQMAADTPVVEAIWESLMRSGGTMQQDVGIPNLMMALSRYGHRVPQAVVEDVLSRWVDYRVGGSVDMRRLETHFG